MKRRRQLLQVSTFPFLAVLLCTMGSLILLLLVIDRRAKAVARAKALQAAARLVAEDEKVAAQRRAEWEQRRRALHALLTQQDLEVRSQVEAARDKVKEMAAKTQTSEAHFHELQGRLQTEREGLAQGEAEVRTRRIALSSETEQTEVAKAGLARMAAELDRLERTLADLKALRQREQQTYSLVPYKGKHGDNRRPIYIECTSIGLIFHPDRLTMNALTTSAMDVRVEIARRVARQRSLAAGATAKMEDIPYLLMLVRPDGIVNYYRVLTALDGMSLEYGYEFVDGDWVLDFPEDDRSPGKQPWMTAGNPNVTQPASGSPSRVSGPRGSFIGTDADRGQGGVSGSGKPGTGGPPGVTLGGVIPGGAGSGTGDPPGSGLAGVGSGGGTGGSGAPYNSGLSPGTGTGRGGLGWPGPGGAPPIGTGLVAGSPGLASGNGGPGYGSGGSAGQAGSGQGGGLPGGSGAVAGPPGVTLSNGLSAAAGGGPPRPKGVLYGTGPEGNGSGGGVGFGGALPGSEHPGGNGSAGGSGQFASGSSGAPTGTGQTTGPRGIMFPSGQPGGGTGAAAGPGSSPTETGNSSDGVAGSATGATSANAGQALSRQGAGLQAPAFKPAGPPPDGSQARSNTGAGASAPPPDGAGAAGAAASASASGAAASPPAGTNSGAPAGIVPALIPGQTARGANPNPMAGQGAPANGSGNPSASATTGGGNPGTTSTTGGGYPGPASADGGSGDPADGSGSPALNRLMPPDTSRRPVARPAPVRPGRSFTDRDWNIVIECRLDTVVIQPYSQPIPVATLPRRRSEDNALLQAVQKVIERRQALVPAGEPPYRPRIRFLVRPEGQRSYFLAYPALEALHLPMSRENMNMQPDR